MRVPGPSWPLLPRARSSRSHGLAYSTRPPWCSQTASPPVFQVPSHVARTVANRDEPNPGSTQLTFVPEPSSKGVLTLPTAHALRARTAHACTLVLGVIRHRRIST